ncbi:MAG: hypothetical protein GY708_23895 [Actinomycetia bacterium]|nr:hypothetical protein [Actinomycetes bacterium]MCP4957647.1 hypothetical protein [Actinomycetes bacterium]
MHNHHRDVQGGTIRAAVFGASDGLVSNTLLILGVAGADIASGTVRVTGFVGLLAGAVSMAAGEYVSMQAQNELVEAEIARERLAHANEPEHEIEELAELYVERGLERDQANNIARALMSNPEVALEVHTREELGVAPDDLSAPLGAAASSFVAFTIGALLPLVPWFFASGNLAVVLSVVVALSGAALIGGILATQTGRSVVRSSARQVTIAAGAAAASYFIGSLLNVQVS